MIIDFHTHVFPPLFRNNREVLFQKEPAFESIYRSPHAKLVGAEDLLMNMDEGGVDTSVIFGFPWEQADNYRRHNDYIIEAVQKHPERLVGFCCFSPLAPGISKEVERCLASGISGVGELAVYSSGLTEEVSDRLGEVMGLCAESDIPIMLHTNEPVGHKYAGKAPMTLGEIYHFLKSYPSNKIVLAHWGGGVFFYALMKKEVKEVLKRVWLDTAASPFLYSPEIYRVAGEIFGFERILFGTDFPLLGPQRYYKEIESSGIAAESIRQVTGLNAKRLLGLGL